MKGTRKITQKRLKELFHYHNGILYWGVARQCINIGDVAGTLQSNGYHYIKINQKNYRRSRLTYCFHHGYFPENDVDHIDRVKNNDKIENLREASKQCNARNTGNRENNTSGVKGVCWDKKRNKWLARININLKDYHLGRYKSFNNAVCARLAAEQCVDWSYCDSNSPAYQYVKENILTIRQEGEKL